MQYFSLIYPSVSRLAGRYVDLSGSHNLKIASRVWCLPLQVPRQAVPCGGAAHHLGHYSVPQRGLVHPPQDRPLSHRPLPATPPRGDPVGGRRLPAVLPEGGSLTLSLSVYILYMTVKNYNIEFGNLY